MPTAYSRLLNALRDCGGTIIDNGHGRAQAQCPAHDDARPSLSVTGIDGSALLYCHAGCQTADVLAAVGLSMADLYDDRRGQVYRYPDGRQVHRTPDKRFRQAGNTKGRALFHADRIGPAATVYVVEGEKDVLAVESAGGAAVCSAMGAGKAHKFDWSPLRGKAAIIVADRDEPGRRHAGQVAAQLDGIAATVQILEPAEGSDAADHIAAGKTLAELAAPADAVDGAQVLDEVERWFSRFIKVSFDGDLALLALWTAHTHLAAELYTTPRLQLDSTMPESGKTTVLDHFSRLCHSPVQAANLSSPALIPRLLENGVRTLLLDEVDRALRPDGANVPELIGIINSGYRVGASRPVLVPVKGGGWEAREMSTHAPVALAGNSPNLPDDTRSRCLRILLMPDLDGAVEDSDWELIENDAKELAAALARFADQVRDKVKGLAVELPPECVGRAKEKWRPLKRVAVAAGGRWPGVADQLIARGLAEDAAEREAGLRRLPPGMVLLNDLHAIWPDHDDLVPTRELVDKLTAHHPEYWGEGSAYGKALSDTRFGKLVNQAAKVTSQRPGGRGPRGYLRPQFIPVWTRLGIRSDPPGKPGAAGYPGEPGINDSESHRVNHDNRVHRVETEPPENMEPPGGLTPNTPGQTERVKRALANARQASAEQSDRYRNRVCIDCGDRPPSAGRPRCEGCHHARERVMAGYDR